MKSQKINSSGFWLRYVGVVALCVFVVSCGQNVVLQNPITQEKDIIYNYQMEQACLKAQPQDRRVLLMNGVSGAAVQTECMPYTKAPLQPKRFEGR